MSWGWNDLVIWMGKDAKDEDAVRLSFGRRLVVVLIASFALVLVVGLGLMITSPTTDVDESYQGTVGFINGYAVKIPEDTVSLTLSIEIDSEQALDLYLVNGDQAKQMLVWDDDVEVPYLDHAMVRSSEIVWSLKKENWEGTTLHVIVDNTDRGEMPWSTTEVPYTLQMTTFSRSSVFEHPLLFIWFIVIVVCFVVCGLEYRRFRVAKSQNT